MKSPGRAQHPTGTRLALVLSFLPAHKGDNVDGFSRLCLTPPGSPVSLPSKEAAAELCYFRLPMATSGL